MADQLEQEILGLEGASSASLRQRWLQLFGNPAPRRLGRRMLMRIVAWKLQIDVFGDVSSESQKRLDEAAAAARARRVAAKDRQMKGSGGWAPVQPRSLQPGTRLVRTWAGETHVVEITSAGFEWRGCVYPSLSRVANTITGNKWNGPLFFGLREQAHQQTRRTAPSRISKKAADAQPERKAACG